MWHNTKLWPPSQSTCCFGEGQRAAVTLEMSVAAWAESELPEGEGRDAREGNDLVHSKGNHICWVSPECPDQHVIWFDSNKGCIGLCCCFQTELHAFFCSSSASSSVSSALVTAQHHCQSVVLPKAALAPDSWLTPRAQQRVQLSLCCRHFWSSPALPWILHWSRCRHHCWDHLLEVLLLPALPATLFSFNPFSHSIQRDHHWLQIGSYAALTTPLFHLTMTSVFGWGVFFFLSFS